MIAEDAEAVIMGEKSVDSKWENRMRIIPYKVMGQEHQLIIAVKPDQITSLNKIIETYAS